MTSRYRCRLSARSRAFGACSSAGFTLIEILVTLVILSTGIVVVLQAFETSAVALGEARHATRSMMLIETKLAEMEAGGGDGNQRRTGDFGYIDDRFERYLYKVDDTVPVHEETKHKYRQVTVTVWHEPSGAKYGVSTLLRAF